MNQGYIQQKNEKEQESVAVIGMACMFPQAPDLKTYWHNIVNKKDAITEVPKDRWDKNRFYDPNTTDGSKVYALRGGYLDSPFQFDAAEFGIMPTAVEGGEPDQFMVLKTAADALRDAGIKTGNGHHKKTEFILGRGSYLAPAGFNLAQRTFIVDQTLHLLGQLHKGLSHEDLSNLKEGLLASLKPFQSDNAPSIMPNITTGRVANRLGFMGQNYTIDAACASSLFAVDAAANGLLSGKSDLALAGGVHIFNNIPFLSVFCALGAMSRQDRIRPFDKDADGLLPGEGVGIVVLKRTSDAVRDGNRIYAVIKSIGCSSDGRGISVAAPRKEGEILAMTRAYAKADIAPESIGLIEAHGTATLVGDVTEIQALTEAFGNRKSNHARHCAIGSVKSMIGHTMPAAGIAGLIKTALALYHKVLPPTLNCDEPNPKFKLEETPFYVNAQTRPWFRMSRDIPLRAGVNAFGFGGVNAHVVMEEHGASHMPQPIDRDAELCLFFGSTRTDLMNHCLDLLKQLDANPDRDLKEVSWALVSCFEPSDHQLSIIAESIHDLTKKLQYAVKKLEQKTCKKIKDIKGIYYFANPLGKDGKIAFMFPGEGSPYTNMMLDLCLNFPEIRQVFDEFNTMVAARDKKCRFQPCQFIFPATLLTPEEENTLASEFWKADSGLQAILSASFAMNHLLTRFGLNPDMLVGHSAGEYTSWMVSGILNNTQLFDKQEEIAEIYTTHHHSIDTSMTAVSTHYDKIRPILDSIPGELYISNDNCPHQVMVIGDVSAMDALRKLLKKKKIMYTDLPSKEVHHTPLAKHQAEALHQRFSDFSIGVPEKPTYSAMAAGPYPSDRESILNLMTEYWLNPLQFRKTIENMHDQGARIFLEVGPNTNLSGFVDDTLRGKPFVTIPTSNPRRSGINQLCHVLGLLVAHHVPVSLEYYIESRASLYSKPETARPERKKTTIDLDLGIKEYQLDSAQIARWQKKFTPAVTPAETPQVTKQTPTQQQKTQGASNNQVMQKYMDNMARFLALQKNTMNALVSRTVRPEPSATPFVGEVIHLAPHKTCRVRRTIDLKQDIFLYDHPFGGAISNIDKTLFPLIITPQTLNIEMMTEAASLLFPNKVPVEIKNVKANRWIIVEAHQGTCLEAEAHRVSDAEVQVKLYDMSEKGFCSAEATVVFCGQLPPSAVTTPVSPKDISPDAIALARRIYTAKYMTHGRRFQVIASASHTREKEITAYLRAPSTQDMLASQQTPGLFMNPMVMDACAQLTGYWAQKALKQGFITFPAGVKHIRFASSGPQSGELLRCRMRIREINLHFVFSDIEITRSNGRVWAIVQGWTHRRFEVPVEFHNFYKFPNLHVVSKPMSPMQCRVDFYENLNRTVWKKAIAYLYLSHAERKVYLEKIYRNDNADEWLAIRMASKDAVRLYLNRNLKMNVFPADIEIRETGAGGYVPTFAGLPDLDRKLTLDIALTDQSATVDVTDIALINEQEKAYNA